MIKAVIFDLDGTLWPATEIAIPAFRQVLRELGLPEPTDETLARTLGYPLDEIWDMLLPQVKRHLAPLADELMEQAESNLLSSGVGRTFGGVNDTLEFIRAQGFLTFICSNCQTAYLEFTPRALGIADLFDQKYCAGMYPGLTKAEMVAIIIKEHHIDSGFMVGDRFHDIEAGIANDLITVGCAYGTGHPDELKGADFVIDSFTKLKGIVVPSS